MGYNWPGVFLLGASRRTGRFFTKLLFHDLISVSFRFLYEFGCMLHGLFCKLMYYFCIVICCIDWSSREIKRTLGLKRATPKLFLWKLLYLMNFTVVK